MLATMAGRDTKTRHPGVYARHQKHCAIADGAKCDCSPSYYGSVYDVRTRRQRKTTRQPGETEARFARMDLMLALRSSNDGVAVRGPRGVKFGDARGLFIRAATEGVALNKWGRRYKHRSVKSLESALEHIPEAWLQKPLDAIGRGDAQRLVDELLQGDLSGSRIRGVVHSIRAMYRWAQDRELAIADPAEKVRLPAMNAKRRDRVATPAEFALLLSKLPLEDALPFAIAGYGTARHQEVRHADWSHVDLKSFNAIELAAEEEARKYDASWRLVPTVSPLRTLLRRAWIAQGRPIGGKVCPPRRHDSESGLLALEHLQQRVHKLWRDLGMVPIGLHESRHTAATWLDHAGVSPRVISELMGHKTPVDQPGAARITLRTYTHVLPGELERARDQLERFLAERTPQLAFAAGGAVLLGGSK